MWKGDWLISELLQVVGTQVDGHKEIKIIIIPEEKHTTHHQLQSQTTEKEDN